MRTEMVWKICGFWNILATLKLDCLFFMAFFLPFLGGSDVRIFSSAHDVTARAARGTRGLENSPIYCLMCVKYE